jgi:hypothetical protein
MVPAAGEEDILAGDPVAADAEAINRESLFVQAGTVFSGVGIPGAGIKLISIWESTTGSIPPHPLP